LKISKYGLIALFLLFTDYKSNLTLGHKFLSKCSLVRSFRSGFLKSFFYQSGQELDKFQNVYNKWKCSKPNQSQPLLHRINVKQTNKPFFSKVWSDSTTSISAQEGFCCFLFSLPSKLKREDIYSQQSKRNCLIHTKKNGIDATVLCKRQLEQDNENGRGRKGHSVCIEFQQFRSRT